MYRIRREFKTKNVSLFLSIYKITNDLFLIRRDNYCAVKLGKNLSARQLSVQKYLSNMLKTPVQMRNRRRAYL